MLSHISRKFLRTAKAAKRSNAVVFVDAIGAFYSVLIEAVVGLATTREQRRLNMTKLGFGEEQ